MNRAPEQTFPTALESCPAEVRESIEAIRAGEDLTFEKALGIANVEDAALDALVRVADAFQ